MTGELPSPARAWGGFVILGLSALFAMVDRQVLSLVAEPLRLSIGLNDTQLGVVQGIGLLFVAVIASFPIGWLSDHCDRRVVLGGCMLVWAVATAACAGTHHFASLLIACCGIGIGEAGLAPICYSLFPDMFSEEARGFANRVFITICILGAAVGLAVGGGVLAIAQRVQPFLPAALASLAPWRLTLIGVAIPAPFLIGALPFIKARARGTRSEAPGDVSGSHLGSYLYAQRRTVACVYASTAFFCAALGCTLSWIPAMMIRSFGQSAVQVGTRLGFCVAVGSICGLLVATGVSRVLRRRWGRSLPVRIAVCALGGAVLPTVLLGFVGSAWGAYFCIGSLFACSLMANGELPTVMQDMAPAALRGRIVAIGVMAGSGAQGLSPVLVGGISDILGHGPQALRLAIVLCSAPLWTAAALMMGLTRRGNV
jgi:MFS family permease